MKLWPARTNQKKSDVEVVTDLDAMLSEPVPFRFNKKVHYLKPVELGAFLKFTNARIALTEEKKDGSPLTKDELVKRYHDVISSVCDSISYEDIYHMSQTQVAALYQLVIDMITGQVDLGDGKKKRRRADIYNYAEPSSSQNAVSSSAGPLK